MKKIKILHVLSSLEITNGIASFIMNYYRYIDHNKFEFDFLITKEQNDYESETSKFGTKIFVVHEPTVKNLIKYIDDIKNVFLQNKDFDIIHCHTPNAGAFVLPIAKKYSTASIILHSHVTKSSDIFVRKIRNDFLQLIAKKYSNYYLACSKDAGDYLFGVNSKYEVIKNSINLEKFLLNEKIRMQVRKKYNISTQTVIGFVGRFVNQKNPLFAIDVFNEYLKINNNAIFLIIGTGMLEEQMKNKISSYKIEDKVIIEKPQTDIQNFHMAMDMFLLPSEYEGLGIVLIEAQAAGLQTFTSTNVPNDSNVSKNIHYLSLNSSAHYWASEINKVNWQNEKVHDSSLIIESGYDIKSSVKKIRMLLREGS